MYEHTAQARARIRELRTLAAEEPEGEGEEPTLRRVEKPSGMPKPAREPEPLHDPMGEVSDEVAGQEKGSRR